MPRRRPGVPSSAPKAAAPAKNLELEVRSVAFGGEGVASVDGKTCFVEGALAGETVIARILQEKKNFIRARVLKVLEPSVSRVEPPCPYVDRCGGCQYQHASYEEELLMKRQQLTVMLERAIGLPPDLVKNVKRGRSEYRYRNSVTLHRSTKDSPLPQPLGFIGRDNETCVQVDDCLLADERLKPVFRRAARLRRGHDRVTFKLSEKGEIVSDQEPVFVRIRLGGQTLVSSARGFFQNNLEVAGLLTAQVAEWTRAVAPDTFFDLYAGVGTFAFLAAEGVPRVLCVEESPESLQALSMNRSERARRDVQIIEGRAEKALASVMKPEEMGRVLICLDPPRGGMEKELASYIGKQVRAAALIYVSCDPSTFARDLRSLIEPGGYEVTEVVPFDMFPRTKHIELAAFLTAKGAHLGP